MPLQIAICHWIQEKNTLVKGNQALRKLMAGWRIWTGNFPANGMTENQLQGSVKPDQPPKELRIIPTHKVHIRCNQCGSTNLKLVFRMEKPDTHTYLHCQNCQRREQFA